MARAALRAVLLCGIVAATAWCLLSLSRSGPPHVNWRALETREHHVGALEWAKARACDTPRHHGLLTTLLMT